MSCCEEVKTMFNGLLKEMHESSTRLERLLSLVTGEENMSDESKEVEEITASYECGLCIFCRNVPGDAHKSCMNPSSSVKGHPWGVSHGWFFTLSIMTPLGNSQNVTTLPVRRQANYDRRSAKESESA